MAFFPYFISLLTFYILLRAVTAAPAIAADTGVFRINDPGGEPFAVGTRLGLFFTNTSWDERDHKNQDSDVNIYNSSNSKPEWVHTRTGRDNCMQEATSHIEPPRNGGAWGACEAIALLYASPGVGEGHYRIPLSLFARYAGRKYGVPLLSSNGRCILNVELALSGGQNVSEIIGKADDIWVGNMDIVEMMGVAMADQKTIDEPDLEATGAMGCLFGYEPEQEGWVSDHEKAKDERVRLRWRVTGPDEEN